ncbi:MAG: ABC transporter substrate-binding protein [Candidatus Bipolaricaulia bacterium]
MLSESSRDKDKSLTRRRFLKFTGGSLLSLSLPFALSNSARTASGPLKVGGIFSLTGPNAPVGKTIEKGARLAVNRINDGGGIGGEIKLELVVKDGKTSQTGASKAARRLVNRGDIGFALGPLIGTHGMATQPIFGAAKIPQVFFGTVASFTENHSKYPLSIRYGTRTILQMAPVIKYLMEEREDKQLYLFVPNNQQGRIYEDVVRKLLERTNGGEVVGVDYYTPFQTDFSPLLTKALNSSADGVIMGTGIPADIISVVRQFDRRGIDKDEFGFYTGQTPNGSVDFERQVLEKGMGDGIIYAVHYESEDYERGFKGGRTPSQAKEMEAAFVKKYGHPPVSPPSGSWGWGSMYILKQAIEGMIERRGKEEVLSLDRRQSLPQEAISYLLPPSSSSEPGPVMKTPYGNYGFLSCGQFNIRLGVGTFKGQKHYLLKDRGYGEDLLGPLCS